MFEIASIQYKPQRCGKSNCKCTKDGALHGGYYWLVTYVEGRNVWKYLGKDTTRAMAKLRNDFPEEANNSKLVKKLEDALKLETLTEITPANKASIAS